MENLNLFFSEQANFGVNEIISYLTELEKIVKLGKETVKKRLMKLTNIVDKKIPYRDGHSIRVSKFSFEVAKRLNLSKQEIFNIELSALLHDFGKIAIEEHVLQKSEKLTEQDWIEIKMHPIRGYLIVQGFKFLKETLCGIRWHHERLDGSGYPDGLKRDEIPFMARVIAVSDAFDAMTQKRPYKEKIRVTHAKKILKDNEIILFDNEIVSTFLSIPYNRIHSILQWNPNFLVDKP